MLRKLYIKLFKPTRLVDLQLVSFEDADAMIHLGTGFELAKTDEEYLEKNMVWIGKRQPILE